MARVALLIGSTQYQKGFQPLPAVAENLRRLAALLNDPEIGGFEVETLLNPDHGQMRIKLETWLRQRRKSDVSLLYLTGHGVKDRERKLYFAATDTSKPDEELITSTALAAADLRSYLRQSRAGKQVVILDCCFSGAFGDLVAMDDGSVDVEAALLEQDRPGRVLLTSSSSMQYSFVEEGAELSLYTQYLLEGLETGAADANDDEAITADELHRYVSRKVMEVSSNMTPKIFVLKDEGYHIRIAKVPIGDPKVRYRKELETIAQEDDGEISFINRECLQLLVEELTAFGFTTEQAENIEQQVLEPLRQRRAKENKYADIFAKAIQLYYPLRDRDLKALARLQRRLGLQAEDYRRIEEIVITENDVQPAKSSTKKKTGIKDIKVTELTISSHYSPVDKSKFIDAGELPLETQHADDHRLRHLLQTHQWRDADQETYRYSPSDKSKSIDFGELPLKTEHADYHRLRNLLQTHQWRDADQETYRLMIATVGKKDGDWFSNDDLIEFPCPDLRILDQLWLEYSAGQFGFSVQKKIWKECGKPITANDAWERFGERVGWRKNGKWLKYSKLMLSKRGELPRKFWGGSTLRQIVSSSFRRRMFSLFSREDL